MDALKDLREFTGLQINLLKSNIYLSGGCANNVSLLKIYRFQQGVLPCKILTTSKDISKVDCGFLIDALRYMYWSFMLFQGVIKDGEQILIGSINA